MRRKAWQRCKAGKHVACTVPMATTVDECRRFVEAQRASGKNYMMMETVVYSREFLFVKQLYESGELGRIQFLRGSPSQEMAGWPGYWPGLPPMHYATHCVSPCLACWASMAESVVCHGSGRISDELIKQYGSPFAVETATFKMRDSDVVAEVTRSLFETARQYRESFDVYGDKKSFEWQRIEDEKPRIHTKNTPEHRWPRPIFRSRSRCPTSPIACRGRFASSPTKGVYDMQGNAAPVVHARERPRRFAPAPGARVHRCRSSKSRTPLPDAATSANWTMTGICAMNRR